MVLQNLRILIIVFCVLVFPSTRALFAFSVTDALGRVLSFDYVPERVVLAGRGVLMVADALYLFPETPSRLVAVEKITQGKGDFLSAIDPGFCTKIVLPVEVGPEQVAALRPDLVILKSYMEEKLGKTLGLLGIKVAYLDFETPDQFERDIAALGRIFQNEKRAADIIAFYTERTSRVEKATLNLEEAGKPRVLLLYYSERDGKSAFNVPPPSWMQTILVERAGGIPVWKTGAAGKGWTKVGFEQIAAWDPDQVFITAYFNDADSVVEKLYADKTWRSLRAARGKQLYAFPSDYYSWDQPDPRWILGLIWLALKLHPELSAGVDVSREVREFFKEMYFQNDDAFLRIIRPVLSGELN